MTPDASYSEQEATLGELLLERLVDTERDVVLFPVRHHSPTAAALLAEWIANHRPSAVLVEGPSDFNPDIEQLWLPHQLPIAIYSYLRSQSDIRGAYYPFCEYSPEWVALTSAQRIGADASFIDLPWQQLARGEVTSHRYADAELRRSRFTARLCQRLQVEDFDDLWDKLVESEPRLEVGEYLRRVHSLCFNIRLWEASISAADRRREAFMAERVRHKLAESSGQLLIVTGGFHSSAILARLEAERHTEYLVCPGLDDPAPMPVAAVDEVGIALTPYSYARLDGLSGYDAGMPSPGFYEHAYRECGSGAGFSHRPLLAKLVRELRRQHQVLSTADLIAVEASAQTLASLRGRERVWRRDLLDAVRSVLVKDELEAGCASPFIDAVHEVLRGQRRGHLAEGTKAPALLHDMRATLTTLDLDVERSSRTIELDLLDAEDLRRSRALHRLRLLDIQGFERRDGTNFLERHDLTRLWESWRLWWSPERDSSCIEAARYGPTLLDAAANRLLESTQGQRHDAAQAAALLVEAAHAGIERHSPRLLGELSQQIALESSFVVASTALGHLLFLYCHDETFGARETREVGQLVSAAFQRCLWLLDLTQDDAGGRVVAGMQSLLETTQRARSELELNQEELLTVLSIVQSDPHKPASMRGAASGILWTLQATDERQVLSELQLFSSPDKLGDFLTGLFAVAREVVQRSAGLISSIDRLLCELSADHFVDALPALRLAFTYFTPREKHHMLRTLFESLGIRQNDPLTRLRVDEAAAARALLFEERILSTLCQYGLEDDE